MRIRTFAVASSGAALLTGSAIADIVGTWVENVGDIGAGAPTYRLYLVFDNQLDDLFAITSEMVPIVFSSDTDLVQHCFLEDSLLCDTAGPLDLGGDSWVNIGADDPDTHFSQNFLGGDGVHSVIKGSFFSQPDGGGYYDSNPGSPVLPDEKGRILIAQFSLPESTTHATYQGTAWWLGPGADGHKLEAFSITIISACPGDLNGDGEVGLEDLVALLAAWGDQGGPADLDGNGVVDFEDLILLLELWGPCA